MKRYLVTYVKPSGTGQSTLVETSSKELAEEWFNKRLRGETLIAITETKENPKPSQSLIVLG